MPRPKRWDESPVSSGMCTVKLASWRYFYDYIHQRLLDHKAYVFRGQQVGDWKLEPTLDRLAKKVSKFNRRQHLVNFQRAARGRRGPSPVMISEEDDWWALGQHFGLATPLLDWSTSPFVAAFFAFEKEDLGNQSAFRAVFALSESSVKRKSSEIDKANREAHKELPEILRPRAPKVEFIRPLSDENPRLINQGGLFTRSPDGQTIEEWFTKNFPDEKRYMILVKILIPNRDRDTCLKDLNRMNINHLSLFPDLFGASQFCNINQVINNY